MLVGKLVKVASLAWSGAEVEVFVKPISFKRHRIPAEVIQQAVWPYFRFTLSIHDVEELWPSAESKSAARRSAAGRSSLAR